MDKFKGIFPALLTPFDDKNEIDTKALEKLIKINLDKGVKGFYVGGSTAEVFMLSNSERKELYDAVKTITGGCCTLIAHIGSLSTQEAIEFGKCAEKLGYDAISSVPPFYYNFSFEEIKKYYFDIVDSVNLPMIIYNIPAFTGVAMTAESIGEIFKDERIIGVKHTSSDFFALERIRTAFPNKIIFNGYDEVFLSGLAAGADGGIGSTHNFMSEKFVKIFELFHNGKIDEAQKIQKTANEIIEILCKIGVFQGEKAILNLMGLEFGKCRPPFSELTSEQKKLLEDKVLPLL